MDNLWPDLYGHGASRHVMGRRKVTTTIYITPEQEHLLKRLHDRTKVPMAEYIRQGIDMILAKHKDELPGQLPMPFFITESPKQGEPPKSSEPAPARAEEPHKT